MSNVLIVDPERDAHLLQEDCCLSFADTVGEATRLMFGNSVGPATPDLVATEAVLPDGNAQDVIRLGNERVPAVPVVVCSANYTSERSLTPSLRAHSTASPNPFRFVRYSRH